MRIRITTNEFSYMGLSYNTLIDNAEWTQNAKALFKHNGKIWEISSADFEVLTQEDIFQGIIKQVEPFITSALDKQVSGKHYKGCNIQPVEYIHANGLGYFEGNVIKYVTRYKDKNGKADLEKAIHYLELLIELEYKDNATL